MVEVCKDRTGLLIDPDTTPKAPDTWTCTRVEFSGLPGASKPSDKDKDGKSKEEEEKDKGLADADKTLEAEVWPRAAELASLLRTRIGRAVTTAEVESDVAALEGTGLFSKVRPICEGYRRGDAPMFGAIKAEDGNGLQLEYVAPLGCTRFAVERRVLPAIKSMAVRLDSSLKVRGQEGRGEG